MTPHIEPHPSHPNFAATDFDMPVDFLGVDDAELERALKAVSWNPRDIAQFLRSSRPE